jgi:sigma-54 specific flagellar transcriptional regulator A
MPRHDLVCGEASSLVPVVDELARIAKSDATVLLLGETGTGKEVMARFVHDESQRSNKAFIAVNCGAIPEALLEAELFGHTRGAFTGADKRREGRLAAAEGGTLFLDEIGELPLGLQVKLLRVLQEKSYEPVGESRAVRADFRLVAATNKDLLEEVNAGRFRRDLYYRLAVCPVELPALRARPGDVQVLFRHFWAMRGDARAIDDGVFQHLDTYDWPGNVRELWNLVERLGVCATGERITVADLPASFRRTLTPPRAPVVDPALEAQAALAAKLEERFALDELLSPSVAARERLMFPVNLTEILRDIENEYIDAALEQTRGNRQAAATLLGLQRTTLVEKLRRRETSSGKPGPELHTAA